MSDHKLVPDPQVCQRYGVVPMTLWRWRHDPVIGFPQPIKIRKRNYTPEPELDEFDARQRDSVTAEIAAARAALTAALAKAGKKARHVLIEASPAN